MPSFTPDLYADTAGRVVWNAWKRGELYTPSNGEFVTDDDGPSDPGQFLAPLAGGTRRRGRARPVSTVRGPGLAVSGPGPPIPFGGRGDHRGRSGSRVAGSCPPDLPRGRSTGRSPGRPGPVRTRSARVGRPSPRPRRALVRAGVAGPRGFSPGRFPE